MTATPRLMTRDELDAITRVALARAQAGLNDLYDEFESRYRDAESHALVTELRQRTREALLMLCPSP
jgi:hypothetical protein